VFYFRPGHETYPIFYNEQIMRVIANAVRWACPRVVLEDKCPQVKPIEELSPKKVSFGKAGRLQGNQ